MSEHENEQIARRREELAQLEAEGAHVYPYEFAKDDHAAEILESFSDDAPERDVTVAGRIVSMRRMGKASFFHILDETGRIQIYVRKNEIENYDHLKLYDIGDIVGIEGFVFRTRTGEVSVHARSMMLLAKAVVPLPVPKEETDEQGNRVVHDQFTDKELRYRQRYIDLLVNPEIRDVFRKRARMISSMRRFLDELNYLEVETPILHTMYGGAAARPFATHMNALDIPLYLRISLELNLKRLMVGGFEGLYEIGKNFRNEGLDKSHNPEFTMLELYVAWHDYAWMAELVESMLSHVAREVNGTTDCSVPDSAETISLEPPFRRARMSELIQEETNINIVGASREELAAAAKNLGLELDSSMGRGKIIDEVFSERVQPKLIQPTFVMDIPVDMVPLAKRHRSHEDFVEAWELIINGLEIGPCFSELNDPRDQRERLEEQARLRAEGDEEAMLIDEDFLYALQVGMPPAAGLGIGIDRLAMLLTGQESIRDVIFFPMMRPKHLDGV